MAKSYLDKDGLLYFLQKIRPSSTPSMDGTASTGTSKRFAAEDHVHPSDTSRAPLASPAFTGTPTAPTATVGTTTTQLATTEFVANAVAASTSGVSDVRVDSTSVVTSGVANISLVGAQNTKGVVKNGSSVTSASGYTAVPIISGVPYYKNTTYSDATTSAHGLMTASDKSKLDSLTITDGIISANNLPSYVDDVIEAYARTGQTALSQNWLATGSASGTVITPEAGKIYVLMADSGDYAANTQFRWGGTAYVKLADGGVSSITNAEIDTIVAA